MDKKNLENLSKEELIRLLLQQDQTPPAVTIDGDVKTRSGDFVSGNKITLNVQYGTYQGEAPKDEAEKQAIYLGVLARRCGDIPLTGLDRDADDAAARYRPLGLERVYVDLDTEFTVSTKKVKQALASGKALPLVKRGVELAKDLRPLTALEAAALNRRLVLLGAPGSGKTTFVNRLCLGFANSDWKDLNRWPQRDRQRLPVLIILRDFARWLESLEKQPEPCAALMWNYFCHDLERRNLGFARDLLEAALEGDSAQVFLDGLDEVPPPWRQVVLTAIEDFAGRYNRACLLITCRVASYKQAEWRLPESDFPAVALAPFSDDKIRRFISAWYDEMAERWNEPRERTRELAARLLGALQRPDLARLAPNPLLLTVMALVHTHDKVLPDHRAVLYERTVAILLWRWESRKQDKGEEPELLARLREAGCSETDLLVELRRLAFEAHEQGGAANDPEQVTGISEASLWKALARLHRQNDLNWARSLVEHIRQRAGLLVEREPGVFSFPHRTFQEYLAGVHLALGTNFISRALALAESGAFWREVILLGIGYKVHGQGEYDLTLSLIDKLCPAKKPAQAMVWRKVILAGDALLEMGLDRVKRQEEGLKLLARVRQRLAELVEEGRLDPQERAQAGEVLGALGDLRFDQERLYLPCRYRGKAEPKLGFAEIPVGPFLMGEGAQEQQLQLHYPYWIARYPVTVAQFDAFVQDGGYAETRWWITEAARQWLQSEKRTAPWDWDAQRLHPNRPVIQVTWFEALAYCAWLDAKLRALDSLFIPQGYTVRLPTEAEWEKAARSSQQFLYPWGNDDWDPQRANIYESGFGYPTPVGMYLKGATPSGLQDLAGNVWEWALGLWANDDPVVRGGSWDLNRGYARCAYRDGLRPHSVDGDLGFRVVVSLANSEC